MKLIDKDASVAKIDKFMYGANLEADIASTGECFNEEVANAKYKLCKQIKEEINNLEMKEVDLKKELSYDNYDEFFKEHPNYNDIDWGFDECWVFAKYFFELGLKASQKGE